MSITLRCAYCGETQEHESMPAEDLKCPKCKMCQLLPVDPSKLPQPTSETPDKDKISDPAATPTTPATTRESNTEKDSSGKKETPKALAGCCFFIVALGLLLSVYKGCACMCGYNEQDKISYRAGYQSYKQIMGNRTYSTDHDAYMAARATVSKMACENRGLNPSAVLDGFDDAGDGKTSKY